LRDISRRRRSRVRSAVILTLVAATTVPARASEPPTITSARVGPDVLFPTTPTRFGSGFAWFEGMAPGAVSVDVTVTDDQTPPQTISGSVPTRSGAAVNFEGYVNVTDLGLHRVPEGSTWPKNDPPDLMVPEQLDGTTSDAVVIDVAASDDDGDETRVEVSGLPSGASFDGTSFAWSPDEGQEGTHRVVFAASDGRGGLTARAVRIDVAGGSGSNSSPGLGSVADRTVDVGSAVAFSVSSTDPDGDVVSIEASALPTGAVFEGGSFAWTPSKEDAGTWDVLFTASDGKGGIAVKAVRITVFDPATLGASTLTLTIVARGSDGEASVPLVFSLVKYAASPGDVKRPIITLHNTPPTQWCHIVASKHGRCVDTSDPGTITTLWPLTVLRIFVPPPNDVLADPTDVPGILAKTIVVDGAPVPSGEAQIAGVVADRTNSSLGIASEIADIHVTVWDADGRVMLEEHPILRVGSSAYFSVKLKIKDFPANEPGRPYRWEVAAEDAWGNAADPPMTGVFNVNVQ